MTRIWEATYPEMTHRAHSHRCVACNKIIKAGEPTLWVKTGPNKTKVCHLAEADTEWTHTAAGWTWRKSFEAWAAK